MKKILLFLLVLPVINLSAQSLDTVSNQTLTLRSQDWAWLIGKYGNGTDSTDRAVIRSIRSQIIAANPSAWTTNVQITGLKGRHIIWMYSTYMSAGFGEVFNMGTTTAERATIYTNIRALGNSAIQYFIGVVDTKFENDFINTRKTGKEILLDN